MDTTTALAIQEGDLAASPNPPYPLRHADTIGAQVELFNNNDTNDEQQPMEQGQIPQQMMATRPLAQPTGRFAKPFEHPFNPYMVPYSNGHPMFANAAADSIPVMAHSSAV
ncbi:hypothetical protein HK097_007981, partial [Rhizophlyctis rosea]